MVFYAVGGRGKEEEEEQEDWGMKVYKTMGLEAGCCFCEDKKAYFCYD